jgi:hypothetical protein
MDSGPSIKNDKTKTSNSIPNVRNVLQSVWVRRDSDPVDQINRFLLWSQFGFVLPCGLLLWIILLIFG